MADVMPEDDDTQGLIETTRWRWSYGYYPLFLYFLSIFGLLFIIQQDSIRFLILKGQTAEARKHMTKMYKYPASGKATPADLEQMI